MEAAVLLARCTKRKQLYGIRTQKMEDGDGWRTWAFPIDERRAKSEGYDITPVQGNLYHTKDYPGCPYCKAKSFVLCHKCRKLSCWNGEKEVVCAWCGEELKNIVTATEKFNLSGGDI